MSHPNFLLNIFSSAKIFNKKLKLHKNINNYFVIINILISSESFIKYYKLLRNL